MNQTTMGLNTRSLLMAGLLAGIGIGVLSNVPLLACVNCLLLAWVWGGGIFAVHLYRSYQHQAYLSSSQGLVIGAVAGSIGAVVGGVMVALFSSASAMINSALATMAGESADLIPGFLLYPTFSVAGIVGSIVIYALVGAIGGLIATTMIWKQPVTQPPGGPTT